jgi:hypothetical protein
MNDERPIEKLLRRYAKKRREDAAAPVELHPATRRMLQGEVARRFSKRAHAAGAGATTLAQILSDWRSRWLWALPVLIVLGVGVWMWVGPGEKSGLEVNLANSSSAPAAPAEGWSRSFKTPAPPKAALPAPGLSLADQVAPAYADGLSAIAGQAAGSELAGAGVAVPGVALEGEKLRRHRSDAMLARGLAVVPEKSPAAAPRASVEESFAFHDAKHQAKDAALSSPAKNDSLESFERLRQGYVSAGEGTLAMAPAGKPAEVAPGALPGLYRPEARGPGGREKLDAASQAFVNRVPASSYGKITTSGDRTPVLANFQVEQRGDQLRVIDGDGSTYLGEMNLAAAGQSAAVASANRGAASFALKQEDKLATGQAVAARLAEPQSAQNFVCRVSGTNRTLNQPVVFTWNFVALTNELAAAQFKLAPGGAHVLPNNVPAQALPLLLNNSAINGRAQLGGAQEIEINAVPVSP